MAEHGLVLCEWGMLQGTRLQVLAALLIFQPYPWATAKCGVVSVQRDRRS